jgi:hypothetical protein
MKSNPRGGGERESEAESNRKNLLKTPKAKSNAPDLDLLFTYSLSSNSPPSSSSSLSLSPLPTLIDSQLLSSRSLALFLSLTTYPMALSLQRSFVSLRNPNYISSSHLRHTAAAPVCLRRANLAQLQHSTCRTSIHVDRRGVSRLIPFAVSHEDSVRFLSPLSR